MFAVTLWEIFTLGKEHPWTSLSPYEILNALEERGERLRCPDICPPSIYSLLLSCWSIDPQNRPKFHRINQLLIQHRPIQYRVQRDNKQINQLTLLRDDTISVFDGYADKPLWKGQNHRTQQVGMFPRICLATTTTNTNEKISWPVKGSFIHTGHRDGTGQGQSWGKIDQIDETILSNPIVTPSNSNERDDNVKIVPNILQMNETNPTKPIVTRPPPPPPLPKTSSTIADDLFLIDFSETSSNKHSQDEITSFDPLILHQTSSIHHQTSNSSPSIQPQFSTHSIDPQQFVAKVVSGVTEQLKHDFPRLNSETKDYTPPLIRKFTVPYPTSYYNTQRPH